MSNNTDHKLGTQLKQASAAIELIKISQQTQHTSIKEALRKILNCIFVLADIEREKSMTKEITNETNKTKS